MKLERQRLDGPSGGKGGEWKAGQRGIGLG